MPGIVIGAPVSRLLFTLVACLALLSGCLPADGAAVGSGPMSWRDLDLVVPAGWLVLDNRDDLLLLANEDNRADDDQFDAGPLVPVDPDSSDVVQVQMTTDSSASPDDWRALIAEEGGDLELDERIEVGGLPATSLTYRWVTNGVDTRERVIVVPSRQLVILLQPVPVLGQTTAPAVFDRHVAEFDAIVANIVWGRPTGA
jgi:hypothetical protein